MQPVRMKTEVSTDLEGIRRLLVGMGPQLERHQPGITDQFRQVDMRTPMRMMGRSGETVTVIFEPQGAGTTTAIKVEVVPPMKAIARWRQAFWRWRTRLMVKLALKRAKAQLAKQADAAITPEVLPPER